MKVGRISDIVGKQGFDDMRDHCQMLREDNARLRAEVEQGPPGVVMARIDEVRQMAQDTSNPPSNDSDSPAVRTEWVERYVEEASRMLDRRAWPAKDERSCANSLAWGVGMIRARSGARGEELDAAVAREREECAQVDEYRTSRRRYMAPPDAERCRADRQPLRDGSTARCMHRATHGDYCAQHACQHERRLIRARSGAKGV